MPTVKFQHRGVVPSTTTSNAMRNLLAEFGDWEISRRYEHTRLTIARIAAGLPINPVTLTDVEARLAADRQQGA